MLRTRKFKSLLILAFAIAFAVVSCSDDNEVIEQQEPQSQISDSLKQALISNTSDNENSENFEQTIDWFKSLDDYCGVEAALLAFDVFDAENNSLNQINIVPWIAETGLTIEDVANDLELQVSQELGIEVQLIFVAGILIKPIDETSFEVAEISNFATFSDYFDDCESPDVTFEVTQGTFDFNIPMPTPDDVDFPDTQSPCVTLDFPLDILVADEADPSVTFQETVDELEFLDYLQGDVTGFVFIDFVYPVSLTLEDGTQVFANDVDELETILNQDCN